MPEMKQWYIFYRSAEGQALFLVDLTATELAVVDRFLTCQNNGPDEGHSGYIYRVKAAGFDTKAKAIAFSKKKFDYVWAYDKNRLGP